MQQKKNPKKERIFIGLGSNVGDRYYHLQSALHFINSRAGNIKLCSSIYESDPWGKSDQELFLNMVVEIKSNLSPFQLMYEFQKIERILKKNKNGFWGPRRIDLDIIYYGDRIIEESQLIIPHPNMYLRNFVLVPLNEIAPEVLHPLYKVNSGELLKRNGDQLDVRHFKTMDNNCEFNHL